MGERRYRIPPPEADDEGFALDEEIPRILADAEGDPGPPPLAAGRIDPGRATYDEVRDEYFAADPARVRDRHRPPWEWTATDREMDAVMRWTDERMSIQERLSRDNARKFLETYAAHRNKEVSRLQTNVGGRGAFRREEENNLRWMQTAGELERATTGATPPQVGGGPSPAPRGADAGPPSLLGGPRPIPRPGESLTQAHERARRQAEEERGAREATRTTARMAERERLARIPGWLERPEVVGVQGLSAEVYGHVEAAYVDLKMTLPQFSEVPDPNSFVDTSQVEVRNLFARLAATKAAITDFFVSATTALDANKRRLDAVVAQLTGLLNRWAYDARAREFVRRSPEELRAAFEDSLMLPGSSLADRAESSRLSLLFAPAPPRRH